MVFSKRLVQKVATESFVLLPALGFPRRTIQKSIVLRLLEHRQGLAWNKEIEIYNSEQFFLEKTIKIWS